jgi:hypothetical protein
MKLLLEEHRTRMLANGRANAILSEGDLNTCDFPPVVKLFNPCGGATWLLTELDNDDPDIAFGLCDLGMGFPELGSVRISELESYKGPLGIGIERDEHFEASMTLSAYAELARVHERIVT